MWTGCPDFTILFLNIVNALMTALYYSAGLELKLLIIMQVLF